MCLEHSRLTESDLLAQIADILIHVGVESGDIVDILERPCFGETGEEVARNIKVAEGW